MTAIPDYTLLKPGEVPDLGEGQQAVLGQALLSAETSHFQQLIQLAVVTEQDNATGITSVQGRLVTLTSTMNATRTVFLAGLGALSDPE